MCGFVDVIIMEPLRFQESHKICAKWLCYNYRNLVWGRAALTWEGSLSRTSACLNRMFCWLKRQDLRSPWSSLTRHNLHYVIYLSYAVYRSNSLIYCGRDLTTGLYKSVSLLICVEWESRPTIRKNLRIYSFMLYRLLVLILSQTLKGYKFVIDVSVRVPVATPVMCLKV